MGVAVRAGKRGLQGASLLVALMLFGGASKPPPPRPSTLGAILLGVIIVIGVPIAYRHWRKAHQDDEPIRGSDMLSDLEKAYIAGKMDEAEFRRVRELLIGSKGAGTAKIRANPPRIEPAPSTSPSPIEERPGSDPAEGPGPPVDPLGPPG